MNDHSTRTHSQWSASASARNFACPGALRLIEEVGRDDVESEAAAWGTACHELAESCLRLFDTDASAYVGNGTVIHTKAHRFEVDDEMAECAQEYIDYVRSRVAIGGRLQIEQQFSLAALDPPFEAGGIGDAVIDYPGAGLLEIVDLKGGRGVVVEAEGNAQLRTYALGAMLANPQLNVSKVKTTIVQPRAPHKGGRIRSETFHVADLLEWTGTLLEAMRQAKFAWDEWIPSDDFIWHRVWLNPGDHCKFCPTAARCPALEKQAMDAVGVFQGDTLVPNNPAELTPDRLAWVLDHADMIEGYIDACRNLAHTLVEQGQTVGDYVLVDKVGRRKWAADDGKIVDDLKTVVGLSDGQILEEKLRSPAQIEKILGTKRKDLIKNMWHQPVTGKNLVRRDKTTREPALTLAQQFFEPVK